MARERRRDPEEQAEHRALLADWIATYGLLCPGDPATHHQPHLARAGELTVQHLVDVATGGTPAGGAKTVLCRAENARQGGRLGNQRRWGQP
jgi:hypothetical protein